MRWDDNNIKIISGLKFRRLGIRRTRHAGQLVIQTEIVLEGGGCHRLVFGLNLNTFFGFYRLVQTLAPATTRHGTTRVLIDNNDLAILDDVVNVLDKDVMRTDRRLYMCQQWQARRAVQALIGAKLTDLNQEALDLLVAFFTNLNGAVLLINPKIAVFIILIRLFIFRASQARHDGINQCIQLS